MMENEERGEKENKIEGEGRTSRVHVKGGEDRGREKAREGVEDSISIPDSGRRLE